jgi:hypothetical protein
MHEEKREIHTFWSGGYLDIGGRIIVKWILDECEVVDWIKLAHDCVQWQFLNVVIILQVP